MSKSIPFLKPLILLLYKTVLFLSLWTNQLGYNNTLFVAQLHKISLPFAVKTKTVFFYLTTMRNCFLH